MLLPRRTAYTAGWRAQLREHDPLALAAQLLSGRSSLVLKNSRNPPVSATEVPFGGGSEPAGVQTLLFIYNDQGFVRAGQGLRC
jgi:hypothetical protein